MWGFVSSFSPQIRCGQPWPYLWPYLIWSFPFHSFAGIIWLSLSTSQPKTQRRGSNRRTEKDLIQCINCLQLPKLGELAWNLSKPRGREPARVWVSRWSIQVLSHPSAFGWKTVCWLNPKGHILYLCYWLCLQFPNLAGYFFGVKKVWDNSLCLKFSNVSTKRGVP